MTLLYYDADFLQHETGHHPESAERLRRVVTKLQRDHVWDRCQLPDVPLIDEPTLALVHDGDYVRRIDDLARRGGGRAEADTVLSQASFRVARRAVGAACDAVQRVVNGDAANALCLVRPPGHHALRANPMGFCVFNNIAVAARFALDQLDLNRVLIVDWDVHHGNGTQDAFWESPQVGFFSIHRFPFYPGTGQASETGHGAGLGTTCNLPLEFGIRRRDYIDQFTRELTDFAAHVRPELILVSAGFDSHRLDPVGSLGLESEDFAELSEVALQLARSHCEGRLVSLLEGGYNVDVLPECVTTHLHSLLAHA